jgi:hypothetical protein
MAKKSTRRTNEQKFKDLFKHLNSVEVALLTERVITVMDNTATYIKESKEANPTGLIHSSLYIQLNEKVQKYLVSEM